MSSVVRQGRRGKKSRVLGEPNVLTLEAFAAMEHEAEEVPDTFLCFARPPLAAAERRKNGRSGLGGLHEHGVRGSPSTKSTSSISSTQERRSQRVRS